MIQPEQKIETGTVLDTHHFPNVSLLGKLKEWSLVLYGTSTQPYSQRNDFPKAERVRSSPIEDPTEDYGTDDYAGNNKQYSPKYSAKYYILLNSILF